jgi:hypothetical protein
MSDKEQINTLISVGAGLPPINPYLDDSNQPDDDDGSTKPKSKAGRKPANPVPNPSPKTTIAPDPKEYIAELERSEEESILY